MISNDGGCPSWFAMGSASDPLVDLQATEIVFQKIVFET